MLAEQNYVLIAQMALGLDDHQRLFLRGAGECHGLGLGSSPARQVHDSRSPQSATNQAGTQS